MTAETYPELRQRYGPNLIDIPIPSIMRLLLVETLHPFYIFQVMSCALWFSDDYYYYASAIVVMSTVSVVWTIVFTRKNLINLREMARSDCQITVRRGQESTLVIVLHLVLFRPLALRTNAYLCIAYRIAYRTQIDHSYHLLGSSDPTLQRWKCTARTWSPATL